MKYAIRISFKTATNTLQSDQFDSFFSSLIFQVFNRACNIQFDNLDALDIIRHIYEWDIFNITGQLEYCPLSINIRNISISNPILKRLSILHVSYLIEKNRINITTLARLISFAPLTIQLYFQDELVYRSNWGLIKNATIIQKTCVRSSSNRNDILQNCPMLKYENDYYILTQIISVAIAIKRRQSIIDVFFTCIVIFLVTVGTLCIGCGLEMEQLIKNFKRPLPLIVGLICQ